MTEWCVTAEVAPRVAFRTWADVEPDEHDRGRSTQWDEEHEGRDYS